MEVTYEVFSEIIANNLGISIEEVMPDVSLREDLGIDSLSMVNILVKFEKHYNVKIELDNVWSLNTLKDLYDSFTRHIK